MNRQAKCPHGNKVTHATMHLGRPFYNERSFPMKEEVISTTPLSRSGDSTLAKERDCTFFFLSPVCLHVRGREEICSHVAIYVL